MYSSCMETTCIHSSDIQSKGTDSLLKHTQYFFQVGGGGGGGGVGKIHQPKITEGANSEVCIG